jgi:hypothetical protein
MSRAVSLAAVLVAVIVLAGQAQNNSARQRGGRGGGFQPPAFQRVAGERKAGETPAEAVPGEPDRRPKTELLPPNAVGLPHDSAPQHAIASAADGQLKLARFAFQNQQQYVVAKIEIDGETTSESILRTVPVGSVHTSWHDLNAIRGYLDGEELDAVQLANKLEKSTHVLISTKKIDPFYLETIKPGTIQLIVPESLVFQNQGGQPVQPGFFFQAQPAAGMVN